MIPDKAELRTRMRAERVRFAATHPAPLPVPEAFAERLAPGLKVTAYVPMAGEADPSLLVAAARAAGCTIALPHIVDRATPMRFLRWEPADALHPGSFGLTQPSPDAEEIAPDIILTPLVAFDHRLDRLGQGAGYYDRAFARFPDAWRVGVAWSVQEVPAVPTEMWDVPLQAVITEQGMFCHHDR
jgi:5-formyltetrahydrofolate cyclo-ligase